MVLAAVLLAHFVQLWELVEQPLRSLQVNAGVPVYLPPHHSGQPSGASVMRP